MESQLNIMDKISLKSIVEGRVSLKEEIAEPSEQLLKSVMQLFKQTTGMNPAFPTVKSRNKRTNTIIYSTSLDKEIRTALTRLLFSIIELMVTVKEIPGVIGGYEFDFAINYTHPNGEFQRYYAGSITFKNNKLTPKFA